MDVELRPRCSSVSRVYGKDQNFEYFSASVLPENAEMLDVFRDSGFEVHSTTDAGRCRSAPVAADSSTASIAAADERERQATIASLRAILKPRAVAVIGASRRESNLGRRVLESLTAVGIHRDTIYPGQPGYAPSCSGDRCYSSARDLPPGVDLAVIAVPRESVLPAVDDCAAAGINGIVVISAGFAETDARGRELQTELVERVRGYGMRMVGPNCMGVINTDPGDRPQRVVRGASAAARPNCARVAERRSRSRGAQPRSLAADRAVHVCEPRQQSRHLGQRHPPVCRTRCGDIRRAALSRVVRQSAPVRADRAARVAHEADRRREVGSYRGRPARRRKPHGGPCRERAGGRRAVPAGRRHPRRHD